ncbi:hypothetical protein BDV38DRAFT_259468 [Aspergillus pseudotamarii]|uniref:Uncharacterized protein n=1 Tax=Aspergillus pseudotamarii TaxID=132259 RepID=A0A5N6SGL5_ASPPS|nr:uncharacterized protein BDV38DRAFT_259468 [Aspergillus pseudotamarii]KAE8133037.1 hypothetical protein BDV38DRAFT_259468 [Aspergillus pseudotamarii]
MKGTFHVADPMCKWIVSGGPEPDENDPQIDYEPVVIMTRVRCKKYPKIDIVELSFTHT